MSGGVEVYGMFTRNKNIAQDRREDIRAAMEKWQEAKRYFESVSDPDLVDYAVFEEEAARRKYVLLLKRYAVEQGANERM